MDEAVLARHGETETSARGLVGGDAALTEAGREQARALGASLASFPLEVCLTSGARRARETAELAFGARGVAFEVVRELGDIEFGAFAGRPLVEYRAWIAERAPTEVPDGGESRAETLRRFARGLRAVLARPERFVAVVAHGLLLRAVQDERQRPEVTGVAYGSFVRLTRDELARAVGRLEAWCEAPAW